MLKALSSETVFRRTVKFGWVPESDQETVGSFKVSKFPSLMMFRGAKADQDICFHGEGLCVIYLKDGHISKEETDLLSGLSKKFTSQLSDRGAKMKWMWVNLAVETELNALFEPAMLPSAVVFNPHKRLRFTKLDHGEENEIKGDAAGLTNLMDKVLGGDARFKMVPGQKLPKFAARDPPAAKKA